jgi:hypothetical protein
VLYNYKLHSFGTKKLNKRIECLIKSKGSCFMPITLKLENQFISGLLIDMDDVLYHGDTPIADALAFMEAIADIPHCFITNNPIRLPEQVADNMTSLGKSSGRATVRPALPKTPNCSQSKS